MSGKLYGTVKAYTRSAVASTRKERMSEQDELAMLQGTGEANTMSYLKASAGLAPDARALRRRLQDQIRQIDEATGRTAGERRQERDLLRRRKERSEATDIGPLPPVGEPDRRRACEHNLLLYLTTYFPHSTGLSPFSDDHKRIIERIQRCLLEGGRFVNAVYRGFAKTTISENSCVWAVSYGHRRFLPLFGANKEAADGMVASIKSEFETNDLLAEDFPEICHPLLALEGRPQRCGTQTYNGERTRSLWRTNTIMLPTVRVPEGWMPGVEAGTLSPASGGVLLAKGLTAAGTRGVKFKTPDGIQLRPDCVIIDDPQTDESAESPLQIDKRLSVIRRGILKSSGHRKTIAVIVNATVIAKNDLIDQLLTLPENAAWQGERVPMIRKWADAHDSFWLGPYRELRQDYDPDDPASQKRAHERATAIYEERQAEADAGCEVSWDYCYDPEVEISAIQHAYNMLIDDGEAVFASEFQQRPEEKQYGDAMLSPRQIRNKLNGLPRGECPTRTEQITAFIDVHDRLLWWKVCAWWEGFGGAVVDYGTWPDQGSVYPEMKSCPNPLANAYRETTNTKEGAILAGLVDCGKALLGKRWIREDGVELQIGRLLIDAGYLPEVVAKAIRLMDQPQIIRASMGQSVSARYRPMRRWKRDPGEKYGYYWLMGKTKSMPGFPVVKPDVNYWKSHVHARLAVDVGAKTGGLTLFGTEPAAHRMVADHLTSEFPTTTWGQGRELQEWQLKPGMSENHLFDCGVGCAVGASTLGIVLPEADVKPKKPKRSLSKIQAEKRKR